MQNSYSKGYGVKFLLMVILTIFGFIIYISTPFSNIQYEVIDSTENLPPNIANWYIDNVKIEGQYELIDGDIRYIIISAGEVHDYRQYRFIPPFIRKKYGVIHIFTDLEKTDIYDEYEYKYPNLLIAIKEDIGNEIEVHMGVD